MHPFSLDKTQQQTVNGGQLEKVTLGGGCTEGGGIIPVTLAIPESGDDVPLDIM